MAHADPSAEAPLCLIALAGEVHLRNARRRRVVAAGDYITGMMSTARQDDEMIEAVSFPIRAGNGYGFREVARRHGDFAMVSVGAVMRRNGGQVDSAIALGGVGATPLVFEVEDFAPGDGVASYQRTAAGIMQALEPMEDLHASADYRRSLAGALVERVMAAAAGRMS